MKRAIFTVLQFALFLSAFAVGGFLPILSVFLPPYLHIPSVMTRSANGTRGFQWDGVILMLLFAAVIFAIQAIRKRIRLGAPWTALALALATIVGIFMKFGRLTFDQ
jgi:hypothetical protein